MLDQLIESFQSIPWLLPVVVILVLFVVYGLLKKLIKMALFILVALAALVAFAIFSGQELPSDLNEIEEAIQHDIIDPGKKLLNEKLGMKNGVAEQIKKGVKNESAITKAQ